MRHRYLLVLLLFSAFSCSKQENPVIPDNPDPQPGGPSQSKAVRFDFRPSGHEWNDGDSFGFFFDSTDVRTDAALKSGVIDIEAAIDSSCAHDVFTVYPANRFAPAGGSMAYAGLAVAQDASATSDDYFIGSVSLPSGTRSADLALRPLFATVELKLEDPEGKYAADDFTSVTVYSSKTPLSGYVKVDLSDGAIYPTDESSYSVTVTSEAFKAGSAIRLQTVAGMMEDDTLTVRFDSQNNAFIKEFVSPSLSVSQVNSLSLAANDGCRILRKRLFSGGSGTEDAPYLIATATDWVELSNFSNGIDVPEAFAGHDFSQAHYKLVSDIDLSASDALLPAYKDADHIFNGSLDGAGHKITGLKVVATQDTEYAGMFGRVNGITVSNLTLVGLSVEHTVASASAGFAGGIAGYSKASKVENCSIEGSVKTAGTRAGAVFATVAVQSDGTPSSIVNVNAKVDVTAGKSCAGGLVGMVENGAGAVISIDACTFEGKVSSQGGFNAAGIIAYQRGQASISDCKVINSAIESSSSYAGGIIGNQKSLYQTSVTGCSILNTSVSAATNYVGGIAGLVEEAGEVRILRCVCGSLVSIKGKMHIGGILGGIAAVNGDVAIDGCTVYASMQTINAGSSTTNFIGMGGIVGSATTATSAKGGNLLITNSMYMSGTIDADAFTYDANLFVGGIIGRGGFITSATSMDGLQTTVVNCCSLPSKITAAKSAPGTSKRWGIGGISGGGYSNQQYSICYSSLDLQSMVPGGSTSMYGAVAPKLNASTSKPFNCHADNCFGLLMLVSSLDTSGENPTDSAVLGEAAFKAQAGTEGALIDRLNSARDARADKDALSLWTSGPDGYPVLSNAIPDPDNK